MTLPPTAAAAAASARTRYRPSPPRPVSVATARAGDLRPAVGREPPPTGGLGLKLGPLLTSQGPWLASLRLRPSVLELARLDGYVRHFRSTLADVPGRWRCQTAAPLRPPASPAVAGPFLHRSARKIPERSTPRPLLFSCAGHLPMARRLRQHRGQRAPCGSVRDPFF
jgi:hypothetical protein